MGDFFSPNHEGDNRTISSFRMLADYEYMVELAHSNTVIYFNDLKARIQARGTGSDGFLSYECDTTTVLTYLTDAEIAAKRATFEDELDVAIAKLNAITKVFDAAYFKKRAELVESMEAEYSDLINQAKYDALNPPATYLNKDLDPEFIATLKEDFELCYDITFAEDSIALSSYAFLTKFKALLEDYI